MRLNIGLIAAVSLKAQGLGWWVQPGPIRPWASKIILLPFQSIWAFKTQKLLTSPPQHDRRPDFLFACKSFLPVMRCVDDSTRKEGKMIDDTSGMDFHAKWKINLFPHLDIGGGLHNFPLNELIDWKSSENGD